MPHRAPRPAPSQRARLTVVSATPADDLDKTEPWERQPHESDPAWEAFRMYRDMPRRSLRDVARSIALQRNRNETTTFRLIAEWSRRWNWQERCRQYDVEQDRTVRAAMLKRHARTLENAQQVLAQPIAVVVEMLRSEPLLPTLLANAVVDEVHRGRAGPALGAYERLMNLVARTSATIGQLVPVERLARGLSTNNTAIGMAEGELFDGDIARRTLPVADPTTAALVRAVLLRAHHAAEVREPDATNPQQS